MSLSILGRCVYKINANDMCVCVCAFSSLIVCLFVYIWVGGSVPAYCTCPPARPPACLPACEHLRVRARVRVHVHVRGVSAWARSCVRGRAGGRAGMGVCVCAVCVCVCVFLSVSMCVHLAPPAWQFWMLAPQGLTV